MIAREAAYQALYERLTAKVTDLAHTSRKWQDYTQVPAQPAMLVVATHHTPETEPRLPTVWKLGAEVIFYVKVDPASTDSPDTALNGWIEQVDAALAIQPGERAPHGPATQTTLGGAVIRAWMSGPTTLFQGLEGGQSVAIVPIDMILV